MTLEMILTRLVEHYGWEEMGLRINIRCFNLDPSIKSSLKFLRKTPWARTKVEELYLRQVRLTSRQTHPLDAAQDEPASAPSDAPLPW